MRPSTSAPNAHATVSDSDRDRAEQVRRDQDAALAAAIDEAAREQREHDARRELERRQHRDHRLGLAERLDRDDRQRGARDARAERADRLRRPQPQEVGVAPQPLRSAIARP